MWAGGDKMEYNFDTEDVKENLSESEYKHFIDHLFRDKDAIIKEMEHNGDHETPLEVGQSYSSTPEMPNRTESRFRTFMFKKVNDNTIKIT